MSTHEYSSHTTKSGEVLVKQGGASPLLQFPKQVKRTPQIKGAPKDSAAYWLQGDRLFFRSYNRKGKTKAIRHLSARISHNGRRVEFNLATANRRKASERARDLYKDVMSLGWDTVLQREKVGLRRAEGTVGAFLRLHAEEGNYRPATFNNYKAAFRLIVAGVARIKADKSRYDHKTGGNAAWVARIEKVRLDRVTPEAVRAWRTKYIRERQGDSEQTRKRASRSADALLRNARALFSPKRLEAIREKIDLPPGSPFEGVSLSNTKPERYKAQVGWQDLLKAARTELKPTRGPEYLALLLALAAGLRRSEIDALTWAQIRKSEGVVRIEETVYFSPKSELSKRDVPIDPAILAEILAYRIGGEVFVVPGGAHSNDPNTFRCQKTFRHLNKWLREQGVADLKPLHSLRKEYGSRVAQEYGIMAASTVLGHESIITTRNHYAEDRTKPVIKFNT